MHTRRDFYNLAMGAVAGPLLAKPNSNIKGVLIGTQTYSFRDRSLDEAIKAMSDIGLGYAELWNGHVEPNPKAPAEELTKWRTSPQAIKHMKEVRRKFDDAGINVYALTYAIRKQTSDDEVRAIMAMANALGTRYLTSSAQVDQAPRIDKFAKEANIIVAVHNHANVKDSNEFATPETFERAMKGHPNIKINLDIGHFTAANFDAVDYLKKHHADAVTLHVKDRKKDQGANVPFGQGDTPIKEVLRLLRDNRWAIPAMIEYEYKGGDTIEEVRKCFDYMKQALA